MRIFGGERMQALMFRLGMTEGVPIESGLISRASKTRKNPSKRKTSTRANTCSNTTT